LKRGASGGSGSRKAHHVGGWQEEDCGGTKGKVGEVGGGAEEGCLGPTKSWGMFAVWSAYLDESKNSNALGLKQTSGVWKTLAEP
jgi:hypothetical protein